MCPRFKRLQRKICEIKMGGQGHCSITTDANKNTYIHIMSCVYRFATIINLYVIAHTVTHCCYILTSAVLQIMMTSYPAQ